MKDLLTFIIPTRNRPSYLSRLLSYYRESSCPFPIFVADSSDADSSSRVTEVISQNQKLRLDYRFFPPLVSDQPGIGTIRTLSELLKEIRTPYSVFVADDDFSTLSFLREAVEFLEANPSYSAVTGTSFVFQTTSGKEQGSLFALGPYLQRPIEDNSAAERLANTFFHYTTTEFSVKRTVSMSENWQLVQELKLDNYFGELLVAALTTIQGKTKKLGRLSLVRQFHAQMTSQRSRDFFDWMTSPDWPRQFDLFRKILVSKLSDAERLDPEGAHAVVKKILWGYFGRSLSSRWRISYCGNGKPLRSHFRSYFEKSPLLRKGWQWVNNQWRLQAIHLPTSPYYKDFKPIEHSIDPNHDHP